MFAQINDGNAIALPFAKGFGWGAELRLQYIFEKLFGARAAADILRRELFLSSATRRSLTA